MSQDFEHLALKGYPKALRAGFPRIELNHILRDFGGGPKGTDRVSLGLSGNVQSYVFGLVRTVRILALSQNKLVLPPNLARTFNRRF